MTKTDNQLKQDIEAELRWDPKINAAQIGVTVDQGAVSLLGAVDSYPQKWAAEDATKRVAGVRTVAQDLTVKILGNHARSDSDIAIATQRALTGNVLVPSTVTAKVHDGIVTLEGRVAWNFEREAAANAVRYLTGVVSVGNNITLVPEPTVGQVQEQVEAALLRQARTDARSIHIATSGATVTLTGQAASLRAIEDAADAAWAAPGVSMVIDQMTVA